MFYTYEAIIITKILMHFCSQKCINAIMLYYFPSPGMKAIYVLCKQQYVMCRKYCRVYESIAIHP